MRHKFHWLDQPWNGVDPEKVNNSFGKVNKTSIVSEANVDNVDNVDNGSKEPMESNASDKVIADNVDNGSSEPGKE